MAINATSNGSKREPIPQGNYVARCYQMIEIGTVKETFKGTDKFVPKVRIGWELPLELRVFNEEKGEQPLVISKEYTLFMNDKANLRKDLKSWRGKDFTDEEAKSFDITKLLGVPCLINITHKPSKDNTRMYEEIAAITPLPKGSNCPKQINPTFSLSYDEFDETKFNTLPDFIKDKMKTSDEYKKMANPEYSDLREPEVSTFSNNEEFDDAPF